MENPTETSDLSAVADEAEQNRTIAVEDDRFPGKVAISAIQANTLGNAVSTETLCLTLNEARALHRLLGTHLFGVRGQ